MNKLYLLVMLMIFANLVAPAKIVPLPDLLKPETITIDREHIYITEGAAIYIYTKNNMALLKKFGKAGEGPQEFRIYPAGSEPVMPASDSILVNSIGKLSYFTKNGAFIKETKTKYPFARFKPLNEKFVGFGEAAENNIYYQTVNIFTPALEIEKEIYKRKDWAQEGKTGNKVVDAGGAVVNCFSGKIFIGDRQEDTIFVFNKEGEKIYSITHDDDRVKVTQDHKNRYHDYYKNHPFFKSVYNEYKKTFVFPAYFPGIRDFTIDTEEEKIYVLTFMSKKSKSKFVVFDIKGKLLQKVFLPFKDVNIQKPCPYSINSGKLYQVIENDESEKCELHIIDIAGLK